MGTLLSALLFIPLVGTRRTFLIFALAIALIAVAGLRPVRRWALAPAAIAALIALPVGTLKADTEGSGRVIYETDTEYQYARVIEYDDGTRTLELNEGQAQHSICEAECEPGPAARATSLDAHRRRLGRAPGAGLRGPVRSAAPRGDPGQRRGTTSRAYEEFFPDTRVDGVEIDPELSEIGREYST